VHQACYGQTCDIYDNQQSTACTSSSYYSSHLAIAKPAKITKDCDCHLKSKSNNLSLPWRYDKHLDVAIEEEQKENHHSSKVNRKKTSNI